jgi:hypothetical protein
MSQIDKLNVYVKFVSTYIKCSSLLNKEALWYLAFIFTFLQARQSDENIKYYFSRAMAFLNWRN